MNNLSNQKVNSLDERCLKRNGQMTRFGIYFFDVADPVKEKKPKLNFREIMNTKECCSHSRGNDEIVNEVILQNGLPAEMSMYKLPNLTSWYLHFENVAFYSKSVNVAAELKGLDRLVPDEVEVDDEFSIADMLLDGTLDPKDIVFDEVEVDNEKIFEEAFGQRVKIISCDLKEEEEKVPNSVSYCEENGVKKRVEYLSATSVAAYFEEREEHDDDYSRDYLLYRGDETLNGDNLRHWRLESLDGYCFVASLAQDSYMIFFDKDYDFRGMEVKFSTHRFKLTSKRFILSEMEGRTSPLQYKRGYFSDIDTDMWDNHMSFAEIYKSFNYKKTLLVFSTDINTFRLEMGNPYNLGFFKIVVDEFLEKARKTRYGALFFGTKYYESQSVSVIDIIWIMSRGKPWLKAYIEFVLECGMGHSGAMIMVDFMKLKLAQDDEDIWFLNGLMSSTVYKIIRIGHVSGMSSVHQCTCYHWECLNCIMKQVFFRYMYTGRPLLDSSVISKGFLFNWKVLYFGLKFILQSCLLYSPTLLVSSVYLKEFYHVYMAIVYRVCGNILDEMRSERCEGDLFSRVHSLKNLCTANFTLSSNKLLRDEQILRDKNFIDLAVKDLCLGVRKGLYTKFRFFTDG